MFFARSGLAKTTNVLLGGIALVVEPVVYWMIHVLLSHELIPDLFGQYASGRYCRVVDVCLGHHANARRQTVECLGYRRIESTVYHHFDVAASVAVSEHHVDHIDRGLYDAASPRAALAVLVDAIH